MTRRLVTERLACTRSGGDGRMEDDTLVKSRFSATLNAPIEKVDIPSWCDSGEVEP